MGCFVLQIDGIDGSGKTSLIERLYAGWRRDYRVAVTKEFGSRHDSARDTSIVEEKGCSELLRQIAKSRSYQLDDVERELLWIAMSRRHNRIVIPKLSREYDIILCDRSNLGNVAPQRVLCPELVGISEWAVGLIETSDLLIFLNTAPDVCWSRLMQRGEIDVIEEKGLEYFKKVSKEYSQRLVSLPNAFEVNGGLPLDDLHDLVVAKAEQHVHFPIDSRR